MLIAIPLYGNLVPSRISFLLAMRYYAGNWAYGIWLFRGESYRKLDRLTKIGTVDPRPARVSSTTGPRRAASSAG